MKRMICLLLTLCLLAGCGLAGAETKALEGKPWINSNVPGNLPDERLPVEDSFDLYVNYDAYREAQDTGVPVLAAIEEMESIMKEQVLDLCKSETAEYAEDEILRILYRLMTDTEKRNADGLAPLVTKADRVKAAETTDDLLALLQEEGFLPCDSFFDLSVAKAGGGSDQVVIKCSRKKMLEEVVPDTVDVGMAYEPVKDTETAKAVLMRMQYSEEEAAALAERMAEFDDYFPDTFPEWPEGEVLTIEQLKERGPLLYAQVVGMGMVTEGPVYEVMSIDVEAVNHFLSAENLDLLKAIIALSMYRFSTDYLDEETWKTEGSWRTDEDLEQNLYTMLGATALIVEDQAYLKHYCPEEKQEMALSMLEELKDAMRNRLIQNTWLDEESRKRALEKLEQIIVAPFTASDGLFDFEPLKIALPSCTTLLDAAAACKRFEQQCRMAYVGRPLIRGNRYTMAGSIAFMASNGVFEPESNVIWIGGPALNMPCFNTKSKATMLGTLGQHLAHELSHAFDPNEALTVAKGQEPVFTEASLKSFMERVNAMITQMNKIEPFDGEKLSGSTKVSELMPDVTGISLALDVAKKTEDFDYAEFFCSFAAFYRSYKQDRETWAAHNRSTNVHPLSYIRINYTVAQFDEFYETFPSVKEGTPMYIAPEDRVIIW